MYTHMHIYMHMHVHGTWVATHRLQGGRLTSRDSMKIHLYLHIYTYILNGWIHQTRKDKWCSTIGFDNK